MFIGVLFRHQSQTYCRHHYQNRQQSGSGNAFRYTPTRSHYNRSNNASQHGSFSHNDSFESSSSGQHQHNSSALLALAVVNGSAALKRGESRSSNTLFQRSHFDFNQEQLHKHDSSVSKFAMSAQQFERKLRARRAAALHSGAFNTGKIHCNAYDCSLSEFEIFV